MCRIEGEIEEDIERQVLGTGVSVRLIPGGCSTLLRINSTDSISLIHFQSFAEPEADVREKGK